MNTKHLVQASDPSPAFASPAETRRSRWRRTGLLAALVTPAVLLTGLAAHAPVAAVAAAAVPTQSVTFAPLPSGEVQSWTVPANTYSVTITTLGGAGGAGRAGNIGSGGQAGAGALVQETIPVTPGLSFYAVPGHMAKQYTPGAFGGAVAFDAGGGAGGHYNGGGDGGTGGEGSYVQVFGPAAGGVDDGLIGKNGQGTHRYVIEFAGGGGGGGGGGSISGYDGGNGGGGSQPGGSGSGAGAGHGGTGPDQGSVQIWHGGDGQPPTLRTGAGSGGGGGGGWNGANLGGGLSGIPGNGWGGGGGGGAGGASYASVASAQIGVAPARGDGSVTFSWTPSLTITPDTIDFGARTVNTTTTRAVTITNTGTSAWTPGANHSSQPGIGLVGGGTCDGTTLAPGASCTTIVSYSPKAAGAYNGTITINSNLPTPTQLQVTGLGTLYGVAVTPTVVDFGAQALATTTTRTVTIANIGSVAWTPGANYGSQPGIGLVGGGTCDGTSLAPGASCTTIVSYTPQLAGAYSGTITITSNFPTATVLPVTGSGQ